MFRLSKRSWRRLRYVLTALGIVALAILVPWSEGYFLLQRVRIEWLFLLYLVIIFGTWLDAQRVAVLLRLQRHNQRQNLILTFKTALVAQMPTGVIGGDVYRTVGLKAFGVSAGEAAGVLIVCRLLSLAAYFLVGAVVSVSAIVVSPELERIYTMPVLIFFIVIGVSSAGLLIALARFGGARLALFPWVRGRSWLAPIQEVGTTGFIPACALSLAVIITKIGALIVLFLASGLAADPLGASFAIIAGSLLSMVPITVAAIGARESGIAGVLILQGFQSGAAFSVAVLLRICAVACAIISVAVLYALTGLIKLWSRA